MITLRDSPALDICSNTAGVIFVMLGIIWLCTNGRNVNIESINIGTSIAALRFSFPNGDNDIVYIFFSPFSPLLYACKTIALSLNLMELSSILYDKNGTE